MQLTHCLAGLVALTAIAGALDAQSGRGRVEVTPRAYTYTTDEDSDRPMLGISTSSSGERDTLGLLIVSVTPDSPADKAGLEEGNRIASINGVNLRLSPADAGESDMEGIATRRLIRELSKVKAGAEVDLRVYASGSFKNVKAKPIAAEDMPGRRTRMSRSEIEDRAVLGLSLGSSGSRRDTLGVMVMRVTTDGPAEKAGLIEGDRVMSMNGVDLRVPREDVGEGFASSSKANRFRRELAKLKAGDEVELRVWSGGQQKTVRVKSVRAGDLKDEHGVTIIGDGFGAGGMVFPRGPLAPTRAPRVFRLESGLDDGAMLRMDPDVRNEIRERALDASRRARETSQRLREIEWESRARTRQQEVELRALQQRLRNELRPAIRTVQASAEAIGPMVAEAVASVASAMPAMAVWTGDEGTVTLSGLRLARVNGDLASYFGEGSEEGMLVLESSDRWRELHEGDVLLSVNGRRVREGNAARLVLDGDDASAVVIRDGKRKTVRLSVR